MCKGYDRRLSTGLTTWNVAIAMAQRAFERRACSLISENAFVRSPGYRGAAFQANEILAAHGVHTSAHDPQVNGMIMLELDVPSIGVVAALHAQRQDIGIRPLLDGIPVTC
ncbi:MAG: hypothetical protein D6690_06020 [Nitrospirae bacterium]|nr:MAG: hypothetical protein D6690_06020 [Nitrospirota bacterium]